MRSATNEKWILKGTTLKTSFHIALFRMNSDHIALFSRSNFCYTRDKKRFILGNIYDWNVFVNFMIFKRFTTCSLVPSWPRFVKS